MNTRTPDGTYVLYISVRCRVMDVEGIGRDAFEMWCWRRLLRIPWTTKRTNSSFLSELRINDRFFTLCQRCVVRYFLVTWRSNLYKLMVMVQGNVDEKRSRGRVQMRWLDEIKHLTWKPLQFSLRVARYRIKWRTIVRRNVTGIVYRVMIH